jgi:preprotein translocase subunit SecG
MGFLESALLAVHLIVAISLCGLVLLQRQGCGYGRGVWQRLVGQPVRASGSANFLSRTTAALAAVFFCRASV